MPIARGLHYLKREGFLSFCRRFLIFATLEWWSKLLLFFKYLGKSSPVIREIQGSRMRLSFKDKGVSRELTLVDIREPLLTRTVQGELEKGLCVLDIGANIGYYALGGGEWPGLRRGAGAAQHAGAGRQHRPE